MNITDISEIQTFLHCETPDTWINFACKAENLNILLIDHANCEKKAASTALNIMYRYIDKHDVLMKMSKLAREELRHFELVILLMKKRGIDYEMLNASSYAAGLHKHVRTFEPAKLVDTLIIGAIIEARSCERFAKLAPYLDDELKEFYLSLLKSESRHYKDYLSLAKKYAVGRMDKKDVEERQMFFLQQEQKLIEGEDNEFRFHSGVPVITV